MNQIYILSGPIKSGKTTRLTRWAASQKRVDGILAPVIEGKRYLVHIASGQKYLLESDKDIQGNNILKIGKYVFLKSVFQWAREILINCRDKKLDWLIIDEIGRLELKGQGLEPAVSALLSQGFPNADTKILLVIREQLFETVLKYYNIEAKSVKSFL
ncbi:MAG: nucleoside-triphosphatase [Calditrichales bacterium]|nr:nucleoside-triphosphatase [Calditrichales bacterium]